MGKRTSQQTKALWLFRLFLVLGLLIIPSVLPLTWMRASLSADDQVDEQRIKALELRIAQLERAQMQEPKPIKSPSALVKESVPPAVAQAQGNADPNRGELGLPKSAAPLDPLVTRIQRRLALVETIIRWRRSEETREELVHHRAGMGVVHGPAGDLLVARAIADPWSDLSMRSQREAAQRKGGSAEVLYRIWGSGLQVLGEGGKVNAQNAMVFDQALRSQPLGQDLIRLQNVGFPGEDDELTLAPRGEESVLAFKWPSPLRAGLPDQTSPQQTELAFGILSPSCTGCVLFDGKGHLIGHVDAIGEHQVLPGMGTP
jgi:hypothetical protein